MGTENGARGAVKREFEALRRQAGSMADAALEGVETAQQALKQEVRSNPIPALILALGAGVTLGVIVAKR